MLRSSRFVTKGRGQPTVDSSRDRGAEAPGATTACRKALFPGPFYIELGELQARAPASVLTPSAVPKRISPMCEFLSSTLSARFAATQSAAAAFAASAASADSQALNDRIVPPRSMTE